RAGFLCHRRWAKYQISLVSARVSAIGANIECHERHNSHRLGVSRGNESRPRQRLLCTSYCHFGIAPATYKTMMAMTAARRVIARARRSLLVIVGVSVYCPVGYALTNKLQKIYSKNRPLFRGSFWRNYA